MKKTIWNNIVKLREQSPLVHNITNYVVMNNSANALLACGASPIMAHDELELEQIISICSATVLNIGTLDSNSIKQMVAAMKYSKILNKPTILDPVAVGATSLRTECVEKIISAGTPTIIRANASEIISLAGSQITSKGVDSTASTVECYQHAITISDKLNCVVSVSGDVDLVISSDKIATSHNGSKQLEKVTGMGCSLSAIHGAMVAVCENPFIAALSAVSLFGICGEIAAENSNGPGSLQVNILDKLSNITELEFLERVNIEIKNR